MDPILFWNDVALEANRQDFSAPDPLKPEQGGPTLSSRALAIVHLAMYDAYAGARGNPAAGPNQPDLSPYQTGLPPAPVGASPAAATAVAAHTVLVALFPRQKPEFDKALDGAPIGGGNDAAGRDWGKMVADRLLALRGVDPGAGSVGYVPNPGRGHHRADPTDPKQGAHAPFYGAGANCFAVNTRHGLAPHPAVGSPAYLAALKAVRAKGIAPELSATVPSAQRRTTDQTLTGIFWAYDGVNQLGTPPRLYNQIVRRVAEAKLAGATDQERADSNARLFALVNVAMGDAGILAWHEKYRYDLWRPVLGVREHDGSMGPSATVGTNPIDPDCDSQWLPLGAPRSNTSEGKFNGTPPFPAYPSGHATFGAAAFHITRRFFNVASGDIKKDTLANGLTFVSDECNGKTTDNRGVVRPRHVRTFPDGLWGMILENAASRLYLGVHWLFDGFATKANGSPDIASNIGGVPLGLKIADDIFDSGMRQSTV